MPILILLLGILFLPFNADAFHFGSSNLGVMGYPSHSCFKPSKPTPPFSDDEFSVRNYKDDLDDYNHNLQEYVECIDDYIDAAKNDIQTIESEIRSANLDSLY